MSTTARRMYSAALRATSAEEYLDIVGHITALQWYGILDSDDYRKLETALSRLYWSGYYNRVMVNSVE